MSRIVVENARIIKMRNPGRDFHVMTIAPFSKIKSIKPGQFVHLKIPQCRVYFRRAFSVYDFNPENKSVDIIFRVCGRGTSVMAKLGKGDEIDILGPLGNGFRLPGKSETALLIAGGVGMPPVYLLAKKLLEKKYNPENIFFFYGANSRTELVDINHIKKLGVQAIVSTLDGSSGYKGLITGAVNKWLKSHDGKRIIYACGPEGMLQAVDNLASVNKIPGQLSLEAPMPCGVGICLGCIRPLKSGGYTRVCRDGPVYDIGEVLL